MNEDGDKTVMDWLTLMEFTENVYTDIVNKDGKKWGVSASFCNIIEQFDKKTIEKDFANLRNNGNYQSDLLDNNVHLWSMITRRPFVTMTRENKVVNSHIINFDGIDIDIQNFDQNIAVGQSTGPEKHWNAWAYPPEVCAKNICIFDSCWLAEFNHDFDDYDENENIRLDCISRCGAFIMRDCLRKWAQRHQQQSMLDVLDSSDFIELIDNNDYTYTCIFCSDNTVHELTNNGEMTT